MILTLYREGTFRAVHLKDANGRCGHHPKKTFYYRVEISCKNPNLHFNPEFFVIEQRELDDFVKDVAKNVEEHNASCETFSARIASKLFSKLQSSMPIDSISVAISPQKDKTKGVVCKVGY